jgi:hypothetical protein
VGTGLADMGDLNPWRSALWATRFFPATVRGPVLARAFTRLAESLRALITQRSDPRFAWPEFLELRIFNVVGRLTQPMCHTRAVPIDFAQDCVTPCFRANDQAIDALDLVDLERQRLRRCGIHRQVG